MELTRHFLTVLDDRGELRLGFELFVKDYDADVKKIAAKIIRRQNDGKPPLKAKTQFFHIDGRIEPMIVDVIGFDRNSDKFTIEFGPPSKGNQKQTKTTNRVNLMFLELDDEEQLKKLLLDASKRKQIGKTALAIEKIIVDDLTQRYQSIAMDVQTKKRIK